MKPKRVKQKLQKRQQAYDITIKTQSRSKYVSGFHKPGSTNVHKKG